MKELGASYRQLFSETNVDEISETNFRFHVTGRTAGRFQYLLFDILLLILTNVLFWEEVWALSYNPVEFWDFPEIP